MTKTPRKGGPFRSDKEVCGTLTTSPKSSRPHPYRGENSKNLRKPSSRQTRFSLVKSTSFDSTDALSKQRKSPDNHQFDTDSDSSLTALSEQDEKRSSSSGNAIVKFSDLPATTKSRPRRIAGKSRPSKSTKSPCKRMSTKAHYKEADISEDVLSCDNDEDNNEENHAMELYSRMGRIGTKFGSHSSDYSQENDVCNYSSDDSKGNYFILKSDQISKNLKAVKELPGKLAEDYNKARHNRRTSTNHSKRSEVALPEDNNFSFEFDHSRHENVFAYSGEESNGTTPKPKAEEEEDVGEEVQDTNARPDFKFNFVAPLIDVPKIKEEELNSDDDYDFDDNDLLATLQAENDFDVFLAGERSKSARSRQSSMSSVNDEMEDPFLREEEDFLVNEFEVNGFDDERDASTGYEVSRVMDSFSLAGSQSDQVIQYASSSEDETSESQFEDLRLDFDSDENKLSDYIDFIDICSSSFNENSSKLKNKSSVSKRKKGHKEQFLKKQSKLRGLDSEEEDDSYLWNYFFSSDADSDANHDDPTRYDLQEQLLLEEVFRKDFAEKQKQLSQYEPSMNIQDSKLEMGYDSSESTDVDLSLPSSGRGSKLGSRLAKEVLSSHTADYRPPVLGTWVAIDSKPFSIIDGLSTRTLITHPIQRNPRAKNWKSFALNHDSDDLAIDLEELLNISELDNDDENDVRIWRDFNNNKKRVPLGAFRNKSRMHQPHVAEPLPGCNISKMNSGVTGRRSLQVRAKLAAQRKLQSLSNDNLVKELGMPSKLRRRRTSIVDAVSEGYRPTKSGLFSENVLADVEEFMGDDRDFMALIRGL